MDELERQKMDALAEFAAGAGHEINNPLAIISGRAQLLLREIEHPDHRRQLGIIVAQVKRAYEMIADIRFFARPPQPEKCVFDLSEELRKIVAEQTPMMEESCISFHVDIVGQNTCEGKIMAESDPVLLHVAVDALCNNAREAVQLSAGNVWLRLRQMGANQMHSSGAGAYGEISVSDDGPGIPDEIRSLIFDPYFSGRQAGRGLGFGLPKTWRIMQLLGGTVRYEKGCEQNSEQGSTFFLTLPILTLPTF